MQQEMELDRWVRTTPVHLMSITMRSVDFIFQALRAVKGSEATDINSF